MSSPSPLLSVRVRAFPRSLRCAFPEFVRGPGGPSEVAVSPLGSAVLAASHSGGSTTPPGTVSAAGALHAGHVHGTGRRAWLTGVPAPCPGRGEVVGALRWGVLIRCCSTPRFRSLGETHSSPVSVPCRWPREDGPCCRTATWGWTSWTSSWTRLWTPRRCTLPSACG